MSAACATDSELGPVTPSLSPVSHESQPPGLSPRAGRPAGGGTESNAASSVVRRRVPGGNRPCRTTNLTCRVVCHSSDCGNDGSGNAMTIRFGTDYVHENFAVTIVP